MARTTPHSCVDVAAAGWCGGEDDDPAADRGRSGVEDERIAGCDLVDIEMDEALTDRLVEIELVIGGRGGLTDVPEPRVPDP